MGLINCYNCGKTISEKATLCPHCNSEILKQNLTVCEDCKKEYDISMLTCPNCGCPNFSAKHKAKKRKGITIFVIVISLLTTLALSMGIFQKAKEKEYYTNMETVSYTMLDGAAKAETTGNLIKSVWYNAIYEKRDNETDPYTIKNGKFVDDFNDALSCLFANDDFSSNIYEIENNQSEVSELMRMLKNPPKKYEDAYSALKSYYDNYLKMTNAVINPTGSLNTFSEDFNTYDSSTVDSYEKMKLYLE